MNHVMIDLETLGTAVGCAVLTIGAVRFDPEVDDFANLTPDQILALPPERAFYARVERRSCGLAGLAEDTGTLAWWGYQSPEARFEAFEAGPRLSIHDALSALVGWCRAIGPEVTPWSHGAAFDIAQLDHLFHRFGIPCPWDFRNVRDTRTLYAFAGVKPERDANHHHALFDAVAQARAVIAAHRNRAATTEIAESLREEMKKIALAIGRSKTDGETDCDWAFLSEQVAEVVERAETAEARAFEANVTARHFRTRVKALEGAARVVCREFYQQHPLIKALDAALTAPPVPVQAPDATKQKVAAALKWSAENKPGHGIHDVPGVGMVHFNDGSDPTPETLARWERDEDISRAAADVLAERRRQIEAEGWTPEHDDQHANHELAIAAACYAAPGAQCGLPVGQRPRNKILPFWPWSRDWWKPTDRRRDLVKAGALILAEIERMDRADQAEREG